MTGTCQVPVLRWVGRTGPVRRLICGGLSAAGSRSYEPSKNRCYPWTGTCQVPANFLTRSREGREGRPPPRPTWLSRPAAGRDCGDPPRCGGHEDDTWQVSFHGVRRLAAAMGGMELAPCGGCSLHLGTWILAMGRWTFNSARISNIQLQYPRLKGREDLPTAAAASASYSLMIFHSSTCPPRRSDIFCWRCGIKALSYPRHDALCQRATTSTHSALE